MRIAFLLGKLEEEQQQPERRQRGDENDMERLARECERQDEGMSVGVLCREEYQEGRASGGPGRQRRGGRSASESGGEVLGTSRSCDRFQQRTQVFSTLVPATTPASTTNLSPSHTGLPSSRCSQLLLVHLDQSVGYSKVL